MKNVNLFLIDATGANYINIRSGDGTFSYSTKRDIQQRKSRGNLYQQREGEEYPTEISMQFIWANISSSSPEPPTLEEVIYGLAPGWVSAGNDPHGPFTVHLQLVNQVPCYGIGGGFETETLNFPVFTISDFNHSLKDALVDCKGTSMRTRPVPIRS